MSKRKSKSLPAGKTLARLQEMLLKAALLNEPLPGSSRPLHLPDLQFILRHPHIYLSDENLAGKISVEGLPKPLRIMSQEDLQKAARTEADVAYLHFQPPDAVEDTVRLTLEGKLITQDPNQHPMGLSSIQVKFRKVGNRWDAEGDAAALAS